MHLCSVHEVSIFQAYVINVADLIYSIKLFNNAAPTGEDLYRQIRCNGIMNEWLRIRKEGVVACSNVGPLSVLSPTHTHTLRKAKCEAIP
jgi:hypothetical protein